MLTDMLSSLLKITDPNIKYFQTDITDNESLTSILSQIRNAQGHPSVLINNAGIASPTAGHTLLNTTPEHAEKIFKVNIISHFVLIRELLPGMLERKKGHIVEVASMASFGGTPGLVDYCATKAGVLALYEGQFPSALLSFCSIAVMM